MRVTQGTLTQAQIDKCAEFTKQFDMQDTEIVEDILSLLVNKGRGLMTTSDVSENSPNGVATTKDIQRVELLKKMAGLKYFQYLVHAYAPMVSLERILAFFRAMYPKMKKLLNNSQKVLPEDVGKQMMLVLQMICGLLEMTTDKVTGAIMLRVGGGNRTSHLQNRKAMEAIDSLINSLEPGNTGGVFDATFSGSSQKRMDDYEEFVKSLTDTQLQLFYLTNNFEEVLEFLGNEHYESSPLPEDDSDVRQMREIQDVLQADPSQLARHTEESLAVAMQNRDLIVTENLRSVKRDQLLYFLVDVSGSMRTGLGSANKYNLISRADLAACISLVFLKRIQKGSNLFFHRFFADGTSSLSVGDNPETYAHVARMIGLSDNNGGGTDIMLAIKCAVEDIKNRTAHSQIGRAEIALITDCGANIDAEELKNVLQGIPLHTLSVVDDGSSNGVMSSYANQYVQPLRDVSTKFKVVDPNMSDMETSIVETVL